MGLFDNLTGAQTKVPVQVHGVAECDRRLAELLGEKRQLLFAIGEKYASAHMEDKAIGTPFENEMAEILKRDEEAAIVETRKLALQGLRKCTACGNIMPVDSVFCNKCGVKQEPLVTETVNKNVCPNCGAERKEDNVFCYMCGYKLTEE